VETSVLIGGPNMWDTWVSNLVSYADRFYFQLLRNASVVLLMTSVMVDHIPTGQENVVHHQGGGGGQEETNSADFGVY
jgi:hypothetical protein